MKLFDRAETAEEIVLRDYQTKAVEDLRGSFRLGHRKLLLQAGTGSGKTIVAAQIIKNAVAKNKYVLFLAHRRELIDQCADKLVRFGVDHGVIMAGRQGHVSQNVQVASIQPSGIERSKRIGCISRRPTLSSSTNAIDPFPKRTGI